MLFRLAKTEQVTLNTLSRWTPISDIEMGNSFPNSALYVKTETMGLTLSLRESLDKIVSNHKELDDVCTAEGLGLLKEGKGINKLRGARPKKRNAITYSQVYLRWIQDLISDSIYLAKRQKQKLLQYVFSAAVLVKGFLLP